jgi:hypothetical protein
MSRLVDPDDFPGSKHNAYLDAANIALMYQGAQRAIVDWQRDVADNGSLALNEAAEADSSSASWRWAPIPRTTALG